jgi:hypothetical protein
MREFEIILFQTQSLSIKASSVLEHFKTFCKQAFMVELYIKLKLILTYNNIPNNDTVYLWENDNFVIKSVIFRGIFNFKNILN